jgi:hypothetical protein
MRSGWRRPALGPRRLGARGGRFAGRVCGSGAGGAWTDAGLSHTHAARRSVNRAFGPHARDRGASPARLEPAVSGLFASILREAGTRANEPQAIGLGACHGKVKGSILGLSGARIQRSRAARGPDGLRRNNLRASGSPPASGRRLSARCRRMECGRRSGRREKRDARVHETARCCRAGRADAREARASA